MSKISRNSSNISVEGHQGTWYVIESKHINGQDFFLLEHEKYGDDIACVIIDDNNNLVLDDIWCGFDDLNDYLENTRPLSTLLTLEAGDVVYLSENSSERIAISKKQPIDAVKLTGMTVDGNSVSFGYHSMKQVLRNDINYLKPNLPDNHHYLILEQNGSYAFGYNAAAPQPYVLWDFTAPDDYRNGKYSTSLASFDFKSEGLDYEKICSYLGFIEENRQLLHSHPKLIQQDLVFLENGNQDLTWYSVNPDSSTGGELIENVLYFPKLTNILKEYNLDNTSDRTSLAQEIWERMESEAKQYTTDISEMDFKPRFETLLSTKAQYQGLNFNTLRSIQQSISISAVNQKPRLFVDMDGTLAEFKPVTTMETLYEKGYFENLAPMKQTVDAINSILENHPEIEVFVLSAYLTDSDYALREKQLWLDKYLPNIDFGHRIFCPCGAHKRTFVPDGIKPTDILLDDYTKNLLEWEPPTRGIKLLNGINDTRQTWQGERVNAVQTDSQAIAQKIAAFCQQSAENSLSEERQKKLIDRANVSQAEPTKATVAVVLPKQENNGRRRDRGGNGKVCQAIKEFFDIKEYAEQRYHLDFKQKGGQFQCVQHDSMWVDPIKNVFIRNSTGAGGSVIDLVMHFDELPFDKAVSKLRLEMGGSSPQYTPTKYTAMKQAQEKKTLEMPAKLDKKYSRVFAYLTKKRGIEPDIISSVVKQGLLYEDKAHHNAVFVYKDHSGKPVGGTMRSTGTQKWQLEIEGSEKIGWSCYNNNEKLFVCEAPIDAMSIMTTLKINQKDYKQYSYFAQGGNPPEGQLKNYLIHNPNIQKVFLCHDNDKAGFLLAEKAEKELREAGFSGDIVRKVPTNNDFNQDLQEIRGMLSSNEATTRKQVQEASKCLEH